MSELDLIPAEYRLWVWQLTWLRRWAWMLGGILLLTLSAGTLLHRTNLSMQEELKTLEERKNISVQQRQEIERLGAERDATQQRLTALEGIRKSDPTIDTLLALDKAMAGQLVWFQQWHYEKAASPPGGPSQASQLTLKGQALDHAALSRFVSALLTQGGIEDADITRSAIRRYVSNSVVDFEVIISLSKPTASGGH